jgi:hypothetical protein
MLVCAYKYPDYSLHIEIYHNRAEIYQDDKDPVTLWEFDHIGDICDQIGADVDNLVLMP